MRNSLLLLLLRREQSHRAPIRAVLRGGRGERQHRALRGQGLRGLREQERVPLRHHSELFHREEERGRRKRRSERRRVFVCTFF